MKFTPIVCFSDLESFKGKIKRRNYFPNFKVELLINLYKKTEKLEYHRYAIELSIPVMIGMRHTHKFYAITEDELKSVGAIVASKALKTFKPWKEGSTSLFSYLSLSFLNGYLSARMKINVWSKNNKFFKDWDGEDEGSFFNDTEDVEASNAIPMISIKEEINLKFEKLERTFEQDQEFRDILLIIKHSYLVSNELEGRRIITQLHRATNVDKSKIKEVLLVLKDEFEDLKEHVL